MDDVAVEIAKLRIWLKIIEGNSWNEEFGRLPNIGVNIVAGNSLVGFPVRGDVQTQFGAIDERLPTLAKKRRAYKFENKGTRQEVMELEQRIRRDRDEKFLRNLTHTFESEVADVEEFDALVASIPDGELHPTVQSVKAQRWDEDGDTIALSEEDKEQLADAGFEWQEWRDTNKSATLDVGERIQEAGGARGELAEHQDIVDDLRRLLDAGFVFDAIERQPTRYDLDQITGKPLHWDIEFPELLPLEEANGMHPEIEFDIVIGNPPYGDILNQNEEMFTAPYLTGSVNDVSAPFVERQLQLTAEHGYFGNVTTLRLIYQSSLEEFHDLLRSTLAPARVACFGMWGRVGVFENALVRVALLSGQKNTETTGAIHTSDFTVFNRDNRQHRFETLEYSPVDGLVLRDRIGGEGSDGPLLPKIGGETKHQLLTTLKEQSDTIFDDKYTREQPDRDAHSVWRTRGVGYWMNLMLGKLYDATDVDPVYFDSELEQKTAFLVLNSSLYYVYWMTYGNQHHHNWTQLSAFPWPDESVVEEYEDEIVELADTLWSRMKDGFSGSSFRMTPLRPIVDDVDVLMGELYDLTDEQVAYTQSYLTDLGEGSARAGGSDEDLTYSPIVAETD